MNKKQLLFSCLCFQCVAISFNVAAIAAAIPAISIDLGLPSILAARIIPYYMIPYGLGALLYAPLARKISLKTIMIASMVLYAASSMLCATIDSLGQFLFARVIAGVTGASAIPLGLIIIGRLFDKDVRGRLVGLFFSCSFIASVAGLITSGVAHWRWLFSIPAFLAAATATCVYFLASDSLMRAPVARIDYGAVFRDVHIRNVFIFICAISFLWHGVRNWFGVYLHQAYLLDQFTISFFFILMALSSAAGQLFGGYLSDKKGRVYTCHRGLLLLAIATMLLSGVFPLFVLGIILVVMSAGWTIGHNGASTILTDFPEEHRPEIASLNSSVRFLSGGIGFFISSFFVGKSFGMTFLIFGCLMLALSFFAKKALPKV